MNIPLSIGTRYVWFLFCTLGIMTLFIKILRICNILISSKEPHVVRHIIPFFGHLWGLLRHGHEYVNHLWSVKFSILQPYIFHVGQLTLSLFQSKYFLSHIHHSCTPRQSLRCKLTILCTSCFPEQEFKLRTFRG
jgi:hypothetical protein